MSGRWAARGLGGADVDEEALGWAKTDEKGTAIDRIASDCNDEIDEVKLIL